MRTVTCKSGLQGWRDTLHKTYSSFAEFKAYDEIYGLLDRMLPYKTLRGAWRANPVIEGSVDPSDFRVVRK